MYHLSNRQKKELKNQKTLSIALPHPPGDELTDPLGWARQHLDCLDRHLVDAVVRIVAVNPRGGVADTLSEHFGAIVQDGQIGKVQTPVLNVECVVCTLAARAKTRGDYPTQWPARWT